MNSSSLRTSKAIVYVLLLSTLIFRPLSTASAADIYGAVRFIPPNTGATIPLDSSFDITFELTGGVAAKTTDCGDMTGLVVGLGITDNAGHYSYLPFLDNAVQGLNSQTGWTSKVIPNGLLCSYKYQGDFARNLYQVYRGQVWIFNQPPQSGLDILKNSSDAKQLIISWRSPIDGAHWGRGGQNQTVANQSGSWSANVGGSIAPSISFDGIERGQNISLPITVNAKALSNPTNLVTEFSFGLSGSNLIWSQNGPSVWVKTGTSNCGAITNSNQPNGMVAQTAKCTYVPDVDKANAALSLSAYLQDHRSYFSESVYANLTKLQPFESNGISIVPKKDAQGNYTSATITGSFLKLPAGTAVTVCLEGKNPSNPSQNTSDCTSTQSDSTGSYSQNFSLPPLWSFIYYARLTAPFSIRNGQSYGGWENPKYECQNSKCYTPNELAQASKSHYSQGFSAVKNATLGTLKSLNFFKFFSPNHRLTPSNANSWCNQVLRNSMLQTSAFDGLTQNALNTWVQGCIDAAVKIPYSK